jgi:hypothetical protein
VFNPALYVRICKPHISVIEVDIRTDSGAPFSLSAEGKLILTLHFKRDYSSLASAFYQPHPSSHQRQLLPPPPAPSLLPAMVHANTVFLHGTTRMKKKTSHKNEIHTHLMFEKDEKSLSI